MRPRAGPAAVAAAVLVLGAAAWPARLIDVHGADRELAGQGAGMIARLGYAGMGYCPHAVFTAANANDQGTMAAWILDAPSAHEAVSRLGHTIHAYKDTRSDFLSERSTVRPPAYVLSGHALAAVKTQFGKLERVKEKMGFCLTALAAIVSGRPLLAGRMITCEHGGACSVRVNGEANKLMRPPLLSPTPLPVEGVPRPDHWPHGHNVIDAASARVVFSKFWGLQAIVVKAKVPVVMRVEGTTAAMGRQPHRHRREMRMVDGILVSFRGTTSFSPLDAVQIRATTPGTRNVAKATASDDKIASEAGDHQWAMNMRTQLTDVLMRAPGGAGEPHADAKTMDGISHEALLLVNGRYSGDHEARFRPAQHRPGSEPAADRSVCTAVTELLGAAQVPVMSTGHSKGGALASYGALLLARCLRGTPGRVVTVVPVEGPRPGTAAFAARLFEVLEGHAADTPWEVNVFRVVKKNDPVSEQPFPHKGDHRHLPGLVSFPLVTALDGAAPRSVRLPPAFVCDASDSVTTLAEWDLHRVQRGYHASKAHTERRDDVCFDAATDQELNIDRIEGGRLEGVTCNACLEPTKRPAGAECKERDYQQNGGADQRSLHPFKQSLADRAIITHPFFGPTFALCSAKDTSSNAMVPTYQSGSFTTADSMEADARSFLPPEESEGEAPRFRARLAPRRPSTGQQRLRAASPRQAA